MRNRATMIIAGFAGGVFLIASVFFLIAVDAKEASISALSKDTMASLVGGSDMTQGTLHEGCGGEDDCQSRHNP